MEGQAIERHGPAAGPPRAESGDSLAAPPILRARQVLFVEDEATFRQIVARNLRARGVEVREAETASQAIASMAEDRPDLLLLDIDLPDRSGWDVLRELGRRGIYVPTVILSAVRVPKGHLEEFRPLAYLPKPFPLEALLRLVLGSATGERDGEMAAGEAPAEEEPIHG
ncbi:Transcriptional regulatory protein WalR [bacterium HR24]|nr:Transcriptional regulatory protein WalR [bacterium HR24]